MIQGDFPNLVSRLVIITNSIIRTRKLGETYAYVIGSFVLVSPMKSDETSKIIR